MSLRRSVRVHVLLRGTLADRLPGGEGELELAEGATIEALADALEMPGRHCVFVVNGAVAKPDRHLDEGDRVQAFPPMAGGDRAAELRAALSGHGGVGPAPAARRLGVGVIERRTFHLAQGPRQAENGLRFPRRSY